MPRAVSLFALFAILVVALVSQAPWVSRADAQPTPVAFVYVPGVYGSMPTPTPGLGPPDAPANIDLVFTLLADLQNHVYVAWHNPMNPNLRSVDVWRCDIAKGACNPTDGDQIASKNAAPGAFMNVTDQKPVPNGRTFCVTLILWNALGQSTRADAGCITGLSLRP